jgi:hypothetical protein
MSAPNDQQICVQFTMNFMNIGVDLLDDVVEDDGIPLWNKVPRIITGQDIFGRLIRRIAGVSGIPDAPVEREK